jgi:DNA-binding CsgD family transcriptional regulator
VTENVLPLPHRPITGAPDVLPRERFEALRAACLQQVRCSRQHLDRIRIQLGLMRVHRERLRAQRAAFQRNSASSRHACLDLQTDYGLTAREVEVAILLASGSSNAAISKALGISPHTARHHTQHVLAKLGVHTRSEAGARLRS